MNARVRPLDLPAVQADDALLDKLGDPSRSLEGSEARFAQALLAWRRDVESEPIVRLMDTDTALALIRRRSERRGLRRLAQWLRTAPAGRAVSRNPTALVAELRALSTADRLVDASVVVGTPTDHRCCGCHRLPVAFVAFTEAVGLRDLRYEMDLCAGCARQVIERTEADYVDVEVYVPAIGGAE